MNHSITIVIAKIPTDRSALKKLFQMYEVVNVVYLIGTKLNLNQFGTPKSILTLNGFWVHLNLKAKHETDVEIYADLESLIYRINEISENLIVVGNSKYIIEYFNNYLQTNLTPNSVIKLEKNISHYKDMSSNSIIKSINKNSFPFEVIFKGGRFIILPGVYPSNRFRSSRELANFTHNSFVNGKIIADIGCSHGTMGILSLLSGAKHCTFIDINQNSVKSVETNVLINSISTKSSVHHGNLFDPVSHLRQKYDVIFFNPPFHLEDAKSYSENCLKIYSPKGNVINNFFEVIHNYIHSKTEIYLAFSNKDPKALELLEECIKNSGLKRELAVHKYQETTSDVRIYRLRK